VRKKRKLQCLTNSDTETILLSYAESGAECLDDFDGMFAFVIYDRKNNCLFLARDRAGKKPLYFYQGKSSFVFASELNTLRRQVSTAIDKSSIELFVRYGALHGSKTPYEDVKELRAGHCAYVDINTCVANEKKWWEIAPFYQQKRNDTEADALASIDSYLHAAVKRRIESSDLEVGSFLSGGIDSGLVTAIASAYNNNLKTFTVSFPGIYNEAPLAKLVAEKYNTKHTELNISFNDLQNDIEKIISNYGEPFFDSSAIPSYYVSKEARKYLTVILNGDGSDELFGGYRRYVPFSQYDFFSKSSFVTGFSKMLKKVVPHSNKKQSLFNYAYRLLDMASQDGPAVYFSATTDIFAGFTQYLSSSFPASLNEMNSQITELKNAGMSGLDKIMCMDFNNVLPDALLVKMDIATMANSLEGRSPFLAKEILEYAPGLKDDFKIRGKRTKYLLRELARKYLPAELIDQPKRGFEIPLKDWVDNELKDIIFSYLNSNGGSFADEFAEASFIRNLLNKKINIADEKRAKMLYCLFSLNVWYTNCAKNG
jgi:asparagine synthase (glutamine-hydrolysing)